MSCGEESPKDCGFVAHRSIVHSRIEMVQWKLARPEWGLRLPNRFGRN